MGIDNSGSQLKPPVSELKGSERRPLGDKIRSILDYRTRQNPTKTFSQLAELSPDHPSENHPSPTVNTETTPPPLSQQSDSDQQAITQLSAEIKQESIKTNTPETPTDSPHLFPDRPSLDELIAQDPNRKTKVSFLTRQKDIQTLKKSGVSHASQIYDNLIKRGVPRGLILETQGQIVDYGQYGLYMKHYASYEDELKTKEGQRIRQEDIKKLQQQRQITDAKEIYDGLRSRGIPRHQIMESDNDPNSSRLNNNQLETYVTVDAGLIKGIDRLDSIGGFNSKSFSSDYEFNHLFIDARFLSIPSDLTFTKTKDQLNQYSFIPISQVKSFFLAREGLTPETIFALDYCKVHFFSNTQNEVKLAVSSQSRHYYDSPDFTVFKNSPENKYSNLFPLISAITRSKINDQKRISLTSEILSLAREEEMDKINCLLNLTDRQQQIFFCENIVDFYPREDFIKKYFDENHQPNLEFYTHYLSRSETISQKVTFPKGLLDSISDQNTRDFYQFISNLSDGQIQHYILSFMDRTNSKPDRFFYDGQLTYQPQRLFRDILLQKNIVNNPLKIEQIKDLVTSESDQRDILTASRISEATAREFFLYQYPEERDKFLNQNNELTSYFYEQYLIHNSNVDISNDSFLRLQLTPEKLATFSPEDQHFWRSILSLKNINIEVIQFIFKNKDRYTNFFTPDHQPTKTFFLSILDAPDFTDALKIQLNPSLKNLLPDIPDSDPDKPFLTIISQIDTHSIFQFLSQNRQSISQKINSSVNPLETANQYIEVINQINSSPSKEILKIKDQLLIEILNNPHPLETYQKISDIFIRNNLPMIGKIYRVFDVLYPPTKVKEVLSNPQLSRVLIHNHSSHLRQSIIFNDLLKVNLGSGELSLVNYLTFLNQSASVLEKSRLGSPLSPLETQQLSFFFKKLDTLYDSSLLSRLQPQKPFDASTLQAKVSKLYQKYNVKEGQSISDRVAEMYFSGLGIKTIPEALSYIKQSQESAHTRNLSQTEFSLSPGDLIKGVHPENLGNILNFGCVAGEYLGSDAGSDCTPFDTDTIKSDQKYAISDYQKIAANGYGDLFVVVKDRGQLQDTTDTASPKYDRSKLEIFKSGVAGPQHYGVRTGFPSSEIDFLITKSTDPKILENIFYEIAKHGVYIPVLNNEGHQIFTPTDYQRYRHSFDGVKQFSGDHLEIEKSQASDPLYQEIINLKKSLQLEPVDSVSLADSQIREKIKTIFDSLGISFKDQFDTSILGSRLYNIGSSGRHTNLPGDFDFDYNIVLDTPSYSKLNDIINEVKKQFPHQGEISSIASQIRLTGVNGIGSESIDLDIGINTTASTLIFASHEAIEQKLDSIRQTYGEDTYYEVVANILLAKKILKEGHAYKKGDSQDGGFGGIGTENWILSNNGSIKKAFETFWQAAHDNSQELTLDEFRKRYFILDAGENLRDTGRNHDNFIFALTEKGYKSMLTTIKKYL